MKNNILRIFSLFAILLLICTMVSGFVEDWMTPRVILTETEPGAGGSEKILADAIRVDGDGMMAFAVIEQTGVDTGIIAERCPAQVFGVEGDYLVTNLFGEHKYILYSTKDIVSGHKVVSLKDKQTVEDEYLLLFAQETEFNGEVLENCGFTDVRIGEGCALVCDPEATLPFVSEMIHAKLRAGGVEAVQVYSVYEVEQFRSVLFYVFVVIAVILVLLILWGILCRMISKPSKLKVTVILILIAAGFAGLFFALKAVYLPSSMLPERHIFDIGHYRMILQKIEEATALLK